MKNLVRIMTSGTGSYKVVVYGKKSQVVDEYSDIDLKIVVAMAKKMKEIYKIENIWSDIDVLEAILKILERVRDSKNMETVEG